VSNDPKFGDTKIDLRKLDALLKSGAVVEHGWQAFLLAWSIDDEAPADELKEAFFMGAVHVLSMYSVALSAGSSYATASLISMSEETIDFVNALQSDTEPKQ
jgi:hypothetical protein